MKYKNAKDVLPRELFEQVQKYASGKLLYVPISGGRSLWGVKTGNRFRNEQRNEEIRELFRNGCSAEELAVRYCLTPESIRNIIYAKKGMKMKLDEIIMLYGDLPPVSVELKYKLDVTEAWGDCYFLQDHLVTYPDRRLMLHIHQYCFATKPRIQAQDMIAEAYAEEGYDVCRVVPNRYGTLSCPVTFEGHDCIVYAEEYREGTFPYSAASPKAENGRFVYTDELMTLLGRIGSRHFDVKEPNYSVLFDNASSCYPQYEDWIAEYTELDLPDAIRAKQPDLMPLYDKINAELRHVRDALRPLYERLPRSAFHGEERGDSILLDAAGHLAGLCDFIDGGSDVCITHFLCLAMQQDEMLPDDYAWLAVHDPEVNALRVRSVVHSMRVIGKEYVWSEAELDALPLVYKLMLFGRVYYYGTLFGLLNDHDKLKEMLDFILRQLTGADEIDFRRELAR